MKLYFLKSNGEKVEIGTPKTYKEATEIINKFLEERNYKSYYKRVNTITGGYQIDVGSHTEFFLLMGKCKEIDDILKI